MSLAGQSDYFHFHITLIHVSLIYRFLQFWVVNFSFVPLLRIFYYNHVQLFSLLNNDFHFHNYCCDDNSFLCNYFHFAAGDAAPG